MWGALCDERTGLTFTTAAGLASAVIFGSESHGTRDHILLSQIRDFSFRRLLRLRVTVEVFDPSILLLELCPTLSNQSHSQSYVKTDDQSASPSWNKAPIWGLRTDLYYCQTVADFLMWGALSDERTGLSFTVAAGPRQGSYSRVEVPRDSRLYYIVSD
jgi:hypothetical protein